MSARDANNATWRMLGYPWDFRSQDLAGPHDPTRPLVGETLVYDNARGVLELRPQPLEEEVAPLRGAAVDVNGEVYRVRRRPSRITVTRCDGTEEPLVCEPNVFAAPRGLALDRRGYLYVADARARRVVVVLPEDGSVRGVIGQGRLVEPVDVAVAPDGSVFVADRGGLDEEGNPQTGSISVYTAGMAFVREFPPFNAEGLPEAPRPVAVMVDSDGTILVADASFPRLLAFTSGGEPLPDVDLFSRLRQIESGGPDWQAVEKIYGKRMPRFLKDMCRSPRAPEDGGERLAQAHRELRLVALTLGRKFETEGDFLSAALDSGAPGTQWHRIEVDADLPEGTRLTVETLGADDPALLLASGDWLAPRDRRGDIVPITTAVHDQLVQSPPGRYLRLRVRLTGNGTATPSVRSLRVLYPRVSYLDLLPAAYRRDPEGSWFLERFLALFEQVFTGVEDRYEEFSRELNPDAAPREVIDWLACLIDLAFDPSWSLDRRRALVAAAMDLYRTRGTPDGIARYVEIYTGIRPVILEAFLKRPVSPPFLGRRGSVLGCALALSACRPQTVPEEQLFGDYAHRFTVVVYLPEKCDEEIVVPVVDRIVETNRPAHTEHVTAVVGPDVRLELQSSVGVDFVLGAGDGPTARLGGCPVPVGGSAPATLGLNAVLSERRPDYLRRHEFRL